jgi:hypothetical protein
MRARLVIAATMLLCAVVLAKQPAADPAKVIAPLIDENTIAVARVDVSLVDLAALTERAVALGLIDPTERDTLGQRLAKLREAFAKAGGRVVFLLAHLADLPLRPVTIVIDALRCAPRERPAARQ